VILLYDLLKKDPRFTIDAYLLLNDGLQLAYQQTGRKTQIPATELLEAIRRLMAHRYGLMAKTVLCLWGIKSTDDIGQLILNLIQAGLLQQDTIDQFDQFHSAYDFETAFINDYQLPGHSSVHR